MIKFGITCFTGQANTFFFCRLKAKSDRIQAILLVEKHLGLLSWKHCAKFVYYL